MKWWKIAILVIVVIILIPVSCVGYGLLTREPPSAPEIVVVERGTLTIGVSTMGSLVMPHQARLSFGSGGTVEAVSVEVGDAVEEGQQLCRLDTVPFERAVTQAQVNLRNAQINLEKLQSLYSEADLAQAQANVLSAQAAFDRAKNAWKLAKLLYETSDPRWAEAWASLQSAEASLLKAEENLATIEAGPDPLDVEVKENQVVTAQASLDQAMEQLDKATIFAPFDGVVASVAADVGDKVLASTVMILLVDPTEVEVQALIDELDVFQAEPGQEVIITLDALPEVELEGRVTAISPTATVQAGVVGYQIWIAAEPIVELQLRDGLTALAEIIIDQREDVLLVPNRAITTQDGTPMVLVMVSDEIEQRPVVLGLSDGQWTEVIEGVEEGEQVIVALIQPGRGGGFGPFQFMR